MQLLPLALRHIADGADKKETTRFALNSVLLELDPENQKFTAVATDSKILVIASGDAVKPDADGVDYPIPEAVKAAPNGATSAVIEAEMWKNFFAQAEKLSNRHRPMLKHVLVQPSEHVTTFAATNGDQTPVSTVRNVEGRYPPYRDIINSTSKQNVVATFALSIDLLKKLLKTMEGLAGGKHACNDRIEFTIRETVNAKGERIQHPVLCKVPCEDMEVTGLIMPLAEPPEYPKAEAPEDNPADEQQPTKEEWEEYEKQREDEQPAEQPEPEAVAA